jgi:hypothetical protein
VTSVPTTLILCKANILEFSSDVVVVVFKALVQKYVARLIKKQECFADYKIFVRNLLNVPAYWIC